MSTSVNVICGKVGIVDHLIGQGFNFFA